MKINHFLTPHTRIHSKWIEDLHVRRKTIKVIEENTGSKISDIARSNIVTSNIVSHISPQAKETKGKKRDYITIKRFSCQRKP